MPMPLSAMLHGPGRVSRARLATAWVFFANGAALGSWVPHIPDAKHALALTDSVLGFALLGRAPGRFRGFRQVVPLPPASAAPGPPRVRFLPVCSRRPVLARRPASQFSLSPLPCAACHPGG